MSLFKSGKYKMGGGGVKTKNGTPASAAATTNEHFQLITASPAMQQKPKSKAPPLPGDANDTTPRFRLTNSTDFSWKLKNKASLFPEMLSPGQNELIKLKGKQAPVQACYTISIKEKGKSAAQVFEFQMKLAKNEGVYELLVDWMNLNKVQGIKLIPDSTSSNQPLKLGSKEMAITMEINP